MLGVSALARFGKIYFWLGQIKFFEKALWADLFPEYDPHKYNSFPMNAARQSKALTDVVSRRIRQLANSGGLSIMPPVLTFQSLVDNTVITRDITTRLYDLLPVNGSELVLFDVNRAGVLENFVRPSHDLLLEGLKSADSLDYTLAIVANENGRTLQVSEFRKQPHQRDFARRPLGLSWPEDFYSLSHVALPFPPDDEIYGFAPDMSNHRFPRIGMAQMVGESGALRVPASLFTRAHSNPFHGYIERRLIGAIEN